MDMTLLSSGLTADAQRRLWFLYSALQEKGAPEMALQMAERMERFVVGGVGEAGRAEMSSPAGRTHPADAIEWLVQAARPVPGDSPAASGSPTAAETRAPAAGRQDGPGRLLQDEAFEEFVAALKRGADNGELARLFGVTKRQANGLRMGIEKRFPALRSARPPSSPRKPTMDRETELRLQSEFLERRPPAQPTMEDVVRFLRQRGDMVVRDGEAFSVNGYQTLSVAELLARANAKRAEFGLPPFPMDIQIASADAGETTQAAPPPPTASSRPEAGPSENAI
jgi:hypothetical protein